MEMLPKNTHKLCYGIEVNFEIDEIKLEFSIYQKETILMVLYSVFQSVGWNYFSIPKLWEDW